MFVGVLVEEVEWVFEIELGDDGVIGIVWFGLFYFDDVGVEEGEWLCIGGVWFVLCEVEDLYFIECWYVFFFCDLWWGLLCYGIIFVFYVFLRVWDCWVLGKCLVLFFVVVDFWCGIVVDFFFVWW